MTRKESSRRSRPTARNYFDKSLTKAAMTFTQGVSNQLYRRTNETDQETYT